MYGEAHIIIVSWFKTGRIFQKFVWMKRSAGSGSFYSKVGGAPKFSLSSFKSKHYMQCIISHSLIQLQIVIFIFTALM